LNSTLDVDGATTLNNTVDVDGQADFHDDVNVDLDLDVDGDTQLDTTNIDGSLTVRDDADLNANLDVDGISNLDTTDIDGSLNVLDMATFEKNVSIKDSLNVTNDAHIGGNFQVDLNSDLDGQLDVEGATNMQSTLTVAGATDLNSTLDVDGNTNLDSTWVAEYFNATVGSFEMTASGNGSIAANDSLVLAAQTIASYSMTRIDSAQMAMISAAPFMVEVSAASGDVSTEFAVDWVHGGVTYGDDLTALDNALTAIFNSGSPSEAGWISDAEGAGSLFYDGGTYYNGVIYADDTLKLMTAADGLVSIATDSTDVDSKLTVSGAADLNSTLDVDGDTELDTTNIDGSLTVRDFADFNDSLDVAKSVHVQDDLSVADSTSLNTAGNDGVVFTVFNSQGASAVTIETYDSSTSSGSSATTLTTPRLVVQEDAVYNGNLNVNGAASITGNVTSAAAPTSPNHLTNKQYVDDAIADAITPPQVFDYDVTSSTNTDTVYYINGDLLLYSTMESGQENYEITVYGSDLGDVTGATLRARGNSYDLTGTNEDWTAAGDGASATFNISYSAIVAQLGGQTDGYISTHLVFTTATATYQSGLTIRFYLDSTSAVATGATFTDPD